LPAGVWCVGCVAHGHRLSPPVRRGPRVGAGGGAFGVVTSPSALPSATYQGVGFRVGRTRPTAVADIPPRTTGLVCWWCVRRCHVALGFAECDLPRCRFSGGSDTANGRGRHSNVRHRIALLVVRSALSRRPRLCRVRPTEVSVFGWVGHGQRPWPTFQCAPPDCSVGGAFGVVTSPSALPSATYRGVSFRVGRTRPTAVADIPPRATGLLCWWHVRRCHVALGFAECDLPRRYPCRLIRCCGHGLMHSGRPAEIGRAH